MKISSVTVQISTGAAVALLSFGLSTSFAATPAPLPTADDQFAGSAGFQQVGWEHKKVEKLQHAYHLLEHADGDYGGHRAEAMKSVKRAAEVLGVEVTWTGHGEESQWNSDRRLHEAKHILEDLVGEGEGKEQPHIHRAIKEIDKALATR